ncbi:hypothetical protein [Bordetella genomosp. 2]|uniref:Chromosome partitioning protein ParB n=1 Tax=Bordetella genomosp. 2 TaxID=1983456 RepID=A0A261W274_9BORD|nr:hypothetical protein [Bordetella genomosp. 2]OZI80141.1 hypothetical protein CAL24_08250 [Bordetella genomosp. 2]
MNSAPLISSQRYLDPQVVERKVHTFRVFVVSTLETQLRGKPYRVLLDGHHNLAAARLAGVSPDWRGPSKKMRRIMASMSPADFERMLINNLTDSDWYFVETGEVVAELLGVEREAA